MSNLFLRDESFYQRNLDPLRQYVDQSSFFLSKMTGMTIEAAKERIRTKMNKNKFLGMKDPLVKFYERSRYEDREIVERPLSQFLSSINTENLTMAPSLTCYVHASEFPSLLSGFTDENVKLRSAAKKEAAKYHALGDMERYHYFNGEQENKKLYNNALSGAFSSAGSVVRNPSAHSTLTSTTRTMTSIGNASNERLISGNRHYRNPDITLNNIVVLAHTANVEEIRQTLARYRLKVPSIDDTIQCIRYSTQLYWQDTNQERRILEFVERLNDEERASVVYTGDLYQLRRLNPEIIREFITNLSSKVTDHILDDPISVIKRTHESHINYAHQICMSETRGIGKDYSKIGIKDQNTLANTCINIQTVLSDYQGMIKTFFLTSNMPCSVAYIRESIRRTVVLSDTDSTMFSCDEWVKWYYGEVKFTDQAFSISGAVMFIATQSIAHNLAIYSANLNVERKKLFVASMKPEFCFSIFSLTSVGKHYYTYVIVKEGSVYKAPEIEIKGVYLKNSSSPKPIMEDAKRMMGEILNTPLSGKKISLSYWIHHVKNIEIEIKRSILAGESTYLSLMSIKSAQAYKVKPELSNYRHHLFWNEIFSPKYGEAPIPTYIAAKFPTTLSSKSMLETYLKQLQDDGIRSRLISFLDRTKRSDLNTLYISLDYIESYGIPPEIKPIIDIDRLIYQHLGAHRLILESLGYFSKPDLNLISQGY